MARQHYGNTILVRMMSLPARVANFYQTYDEFLGCFVRQILTSAQMSLSPEMPLSLDINPLGESTDRTILRQQMIMRSTFYKERQLRNDDLLTNHQRPVLENFLNVSMIRDVDQD